MNKLNLAVVNESIGENRTCLHPSFLERMVQSFFSNGQFCHPASFHSIKLSSLDLVFLGLARLGYPVSLKQVKYYLIFAIPSFIHQIKDWETRIQPMLLKVLPSGVGVYLSPFKDVWGLRIIFAGPNKVFTKTNKEQLRDSNHAVYAFNTRKGMDEDDHNLQNKEIRFDSIEDDILQEMGFELEKLVDEPEFLANF